ncbi:MAG TPA: HAMP domain-containing protein, partial [Sphingomicrobium sp.]|nr:HAMP domain-containing protein [Sphingomicrobium sp.]
MDARTADSPLSSQQESWLQRERASGRFYDRISAVLGLFLAAMIGVSIWLLRRSAEPETLSQPLIALLLVAILLPAIALMALYARKIAVRRAERGGLGSGRLHVRLVALFTAIAAIPTVLVAIFASVLFQSGLEFWFSNRARNMLENTVEVAHGTYRYELGLVGDQATTMSSNMADGLHRVPIDDPRVAEAVAAQTYLRSLNEAAIIRMAPDGEVQSFGVANGYVGMLNPQRLHTAEVRLTSAPDGAYVDAHTPGRISVLTKLNYGQNFFLYAARQVDPEIAAQTTRAENVVRDYHALLKRSRINQLKFNGALLLGSLLVVALSILTALRLADRLVRPVGELVSAAGRVEAGDFSARVAVPKSEDEVQTLATAFNQMTERLEEQTGELRTANTQLDTRRAFIEAVLSSVTAGVIAVDSGHRVLLLNRSAATLLDEGEEIEGQPLGSVSPELEEFMRGQQSEATVLMASAGIQRTLAVKRVRYQDG